MPIRDAASTLESAIESLWAQTFREFRLIAIDDGSGDDTPRILANAALSWRERVRQDSRVGPMLEVVRIEPGGNIARALIAGAAAAGDVEYLGRQDADDLSLPSRFERQIRWLDSKPQIGVLGTGVRTIGAGQRTAGWRRYETWLAGATTPEEIARELWIESPLPHPSVILRRDAYERVGGYRESPWPEDYDLWLRMLRAGVPMAKLSEVLVEWRDSPARASRTLPEYTPASFLACRAHHLARHLEGRPVVIWGAGRDGRRASRALLAEGVDVQAFIDIDPRKIGRRVRGRPIVAAEAWIEASRSATPSAVVLAAVGVPGAREIIRGRLVGAGLVEGRHFLCIA